MHMASTDDTQKISPCERRKAAYADKQFEKVRFLVENEVALATEHSAQTRDESCQQPIKFIHQSSS